MYDVDQLSEALSVVARGTQQGRVVVTLDGNPPVLPAIPAFTVRAEATYLVTGGFGAVGLAMVDWLVSQGAQAPDRREQERRRGRAGQTPAQCMARNLASTIREEAVDVGDALAVCRPDQYSQEQMPALRAVFHAAGVSEDSAYEDVTAESLRRDDRAQARRRHGICTMRSNKPGIDLEAFVLFSSVSALVGLPLQTAYAAANAGLDALAQLRQCARIRPRYR